MSYFLFSRWFGLISVILAFGILFNLDDAKKMANRMIDNESGYIMGGVLPIIFGSMVFSQLHPFSSKWQITVTLVGIFMLLIGSFRVLFVRLWKKILHRHVDKIPAMFSLFGLMLGLLLLYVGYFVPIIHPSSVSSTTMIPHSNTQRSD